MRALGLALVVALGVIALMAAGRPGIATAACLVLPGLGWAGKLHLEDAGDRLALAIAISICALTVVGTTMVVLGRWSTPMALAALVVVGAIGILPGRLLKNVSAPLSTLREWRTKSAARSGPDPGVSAAIDDGWEQFWPPWIGRTADDGWEQFWPPWSGRTADGEIKRSVQSHGHSRTFRSSAGTHCQSSK